MSIENEISRIQPRKSLVFDFIDVGKVVSKRTGLDYNIYWDTLNYGDGAPNDSYQRYFSADDLQESFNKYSYNQIIFAKEVDTLLKELGVEEGVEVVWYLSW